MQDLDQIKTIEELMTKLRNVEKSFDFINPAISVMIENNLKELKKIHNKIDKMEVRSVPKRDFAKPIFTRTHTGKQVCRECFKPGHVTSECFYRNRQHAAMVALARRPPWHQPNPYRYRQPNWYQSQNFQPNYQPNY